MKQTNDSQKSDDSPRAAKSEIIDQLKVSAKSFVPTNLGMGGAGAAGGGVYKPPMVPASSYLPEHRSLSPLGKFHHHHHYPGLTSASETSATSAHGHSYYEIGPGGASVSPPPQHRVISPYPYAHSESPPPYMHYPPPGAPGVPGHYAAAPPHPGAAVYHHPGAAPAPPVYTQTTSYPGVTEIHVYHHHPG